MQPQVPPSTAGSHKITEIKAADGDSLSEAVITRLHLKCVRVRARVHVCVRHLCERLDPVVLRLLRLGPDDHDSLCVQVELHGEHSPATNTGLMVRTPL